MTPTQNDALVVILSAAISSLLTYLFTRKKRTAETSQVELANVQSAIAIYKGAAEELTHQVEILRKQVCKLNGEMIALKKQNEQLKREIASLKKQKGHTGKTPPAEATPAHHHKHTPPPHET